jgi:hypothetical protein
MRIVIGLTVAFVLLTSAVSGTASALYLKHRYFTKHHPRSYPPSASCDDPLVDCSLLDGKLP